MPPLEGPRTEDTEAFPSGMVSQGAYSDEQPRTPERRRLFEQTRDEPQRENREAYSDNDVWRNVTRGPSIFRENIICEPNSGFAPAVLPTSWLIPVSGTHVYGGGPTGPSSISYPTATYVPVRRTAAGGGGGGGRDSPPPDRPGDRDRRGGANGNGNG